MNLDCMSEPQIEKLRWAFRELYRLNKWPEDRRSYNNMALIHQNHCQHGWERFLPWHRIYLYEFEQALQDVCPGVTMPYWDWTMPQYCPEHPEKGWIIPHSFKAFLTDESITSCRARPTRRCRRKPARRCSSKMVEQGRATPRRATLLRRRREDDRQGVHRRASIASASSTRCSPPTRCGIRCAIPAEYHDRRQDSTINTAIHYHYPTADDMEQILALRTFRDFGGGSFYDDSFGFLDQNPHNTMHIWTGGHESRLQADATARSSTSETSAATATAACRWPAAASTPATTCTSSREFGDMFSNLTASYDPVFWPIHVNIDRLWCGVAADGTRIRCRRISTRCSRRGATRSPTRSTWRASATSTSSAPSSSRWAWRRRWAASSRSRSTFPKRCAASFQQAEVRLHRVPQLPRSCFIRVFLNLPDANASTPIDDEHYAGYLAIFGHGDCYRRAGPLRPAAQPAAAVRPAAAHHNTPRNHRVNVTKTAKRLLDAGATSLQITLVVIGADYREDNELLRLDGVSLTFSTDPTGGRRRMPTTYRIHPGIGIARLGNSPDAFCISPEQPARPADRLRRDAATRCCRPTA